MGRGETKGDRTLVKAILGAGTVEGAMNTTLIDGVDVMARSPCEGFAISRRRCMAVEVAQTIVSNGLVEALDFAATLWITHGPKDDMDTEIGEDTNRIMGFERAAVVHVDPAHHAKTGDEPMEPTQKKRGGFRGPHLGVEHEPRDIIDKEQDDAFGALCSGAKVFAVSHHHLHAMGKGKTLLAAGNLSLVWIWRFVLRAAHRAWIACR